MARKVKRLSARSTVTIGKPGRHEIKFDGYRVIARKDGDKVRPWARTSSEGEHPRLSYH